MKVCSITGMLIVLQKPLKCRILTVNISMKRKVKNCLFSHNLPYNPLLWIIILSSYGNIFLKKAQLS